VNQGASEAAILFNVLMTEMSQELRKNRGLKSHRLRRNERVPPLLCLFYRVRRVKISTMLLWMKKAKQMKATVSEK
jgi:hypothetical protein